VIITVSGFSSLGRFFYDRPKAQAKEAITKQPLPSNGSQKKKGRKMMKKKMIAALLTLAMCAGLTACGGSTSSTSTASTEEAQTEYKVGIVQYVDDASLNQIEKAIEDELIKKGEELGVTFNFQDYTYNGQADSSTLNQIAADLVADQVDVIVPIATPTAMIMQTATESNQIPVVFSAVSDPLTAGLVESMDAPGSNITGTSDALNTDALFDLMFAANPDIQKVGLLYNKSEDSSTAPIAQAKAYCEAKGVEVVEKTGTNNDEISLAADALVAAGVDAVFTPTDNTVMTAELAIYEKFIEAGIPHYAGADSFALNGAFCGFGVNYVDLGTATADMVVDILVNGADPATTAVQTMSNGIATVNTETAEAIGLDYSGFSALCDDVQEITTAEEFE
jgi:putative ABC transport system substrate-binding protein